MAYMIGNKGPYPNKAGEFCGNHRTQEPLHLLPHETIETQADHLTKMRFGRPRPCKAGTTKEMETSGHVGLYLKEDEAWTLGPEEREIPTPLELMEPN